MKRIKILGVAVVSAAVITTAVVVRNNSTTTEVTPKIEEPTTQIENELPENIRKVEEPPETAKTEPSPESAPRVEKVELTMPEEEGRVAAVAIVYPRFPSPGNDPCEGGAKGIQVQKFDDNTILCNMSEAQLAQLIGKTFESEKFCTCLKKLCDTPDKFVACLFE